MNVKNANKKRLDLVQKLKIQKKKIEKKEEELYKEEQICLILEKKLNAAIIVWQKSEQEESDKMEGGWLWRKN